MKTLFILLFLLYSAVTLAEDGCAFGAPDPSIKKESIKNLKNYKATSSGAEKGGRRKMVETFKFRNDNITLISEVGCEDSINSVTIVETKKIIRTKKTTNKELMENVAALLKKIKVLTINNQILGLEEIKNSKLKKLNKSKDLITIFEAANSQENTKTKIRVSFKKNTALIKLESLFTFSL